MKNGLKWATVAMLSLCILRDSFATTFVIFVSPQEAIIAADGLSNRIEGGQRSVCKIFQVSEHMIFIASGTGVTDNPRFSPYEVAKTSSTNSRSPREAAIKYARDALPSLQEIWRLNRARYIELGAAKNGPPISQDYVFIGLNQNGLISGAGTNFVEDADNPPTLRVNEMHEFTGENKNDIFLYRSGVIDSLPSDD